MFQSPPTSISFTQIVMLVYRRVITINHYKSLSITIKSLKNHYKSLLTHSHLSIIYPDDFDFPHLQRRFSASAVPALQRKLATAIRCSGNLVASRYNVQPSKPKPGSPAQKKTEVLGKKLEKIVFTNVY